MAHRSLCDATKAPSKAASATGRAGRWSRRGVVLEGEGNLVAQPSERYLAHPPDHAFNLAVAGVGGLDGEGDQQAEEVGMAFERLHGGHDDPAQMVASTSDSADRFIGWRAPSSAEDPQHELTTALSRILGRPIDAGVLAGAAWAAT